MRVSRSSCSSIAAGMPATAASRRSGGSGAVPGLTRGSFGLDEPPLRVADLGASHARADVAQGGVALPERARDAELRRALAVDARARREVRARVVLGREALQRARAHQLEPDVDDALVRAEQVVIDLRKAVEQLLDLGLEQRRG